MGNLSSSVTTLHTSDACRDNPTIPSPAFPCILSQSGPNLLAVQYCRPALLPTARAVFPQLQPFHSSVNIHRRLSTQISSKLDARHDRLFRLIGSIFLHALGACWLHFQVSP